MLYWGSLAALALLVLAVLGRGAWLAYARRDTTLAAARPAAGRGGERRDPWTLAAAYSAAGDYTGAAHALYQGLLEALAQRERLRLHPSKTAGDYVRELRLRSSGAFARFRDFARAYEVVVYGLGRCDRERYERLHALALAVVRPDG